ncbi:Arc family DNA binding domain-containing protein [Lutimonas saemankumensis]|uniref:Arc family DNA binding domain-containing protein n=1 Tax=Lutimonas saemankumensis TaxID=483016 RepID=UPI001CD3A6E3|nr:Arc family DNA binding domain-containing protein [Lutimonas saemankumensis]MCA0931195.1 Arc family DNA binding domain-containing protein [Lutimonas saemankumensis]
MKSKKAFALRIDEELLKAIEILAKEDFRSTNGQIEWMLSKHVKESGRFLENQDEEGL